MLISVSSSPPKHWPRPPSLCLMVHPSIRLSVCLLCNGHHVRTEVKVHAMHLQTAILFSLWSLLDRVSRSPFAHFSTSATPLPFHLISSSFRLILWLLPSVKPLAPQILTPSFKGNYEISWMRSREFLNSSLRLRTPQQSSVRLTVLIPVL